MDYADPALADALASQYVAGTLRGAARRRFESLLPGHPGLRAAVREWEWRLMPLTAVVADEPPPERVWQGIERRLWPRAGAEAGWWQRLSLWRGVSAFATVAALGLAVLLAVPQPVQPPVVVVLQGTGPSEGAPSFVASMTADGRSLVTRPVVPVAMAADRALELWSLPPQGAPKSLGVISKDGVTVVRRELLPQRLLRGDTAALAVTIEPPGGAPGGAPTGPVVYLGKLTL